LTTSEADDDTDAGDLCRRGNTTSVGDAPRSSRTAQGRRSRVQGRDEDLDETVSTYKGIPVDFSEVWTRLDTGHYTSIVCISQ